jgi:hypothetical protein
MQRLSLRGERAVSGHAASATALAPRSKKLTMKLESDPDFYDPDF